MKSSAKPLADIQRLLAPDEAMLGYLVGGSRTHIFVIRRERAELAHGDIGGPALAREVRALREGLDPSAVTSIETLPAASALRALRDFARPSRASEPFIGFGDPDLQGAPGATRAVNVAALFTRGGRVDVRTIRALPPLPETAAELRALAASLHAPADSVHLRGAMTVARMRATDLSRYRVIAFATHGLTTGKLAGVGEPGLIMTPPDAPSDEDSGILTATMIARFNLDADWVILSACNTAAADGTPGAEALSGLARAFFYAGSRALLVSHWAVASEAAERLTTGLFAAAAAAPDIGRAEALRRSILRLLGDRRDAYFAHPLFWAPFVVVGEGGRAQPGG